MPPPVAAPSQSLWSRLGSWLSRGPRFGADPVWSLDTAAIDGPGAGPSRRLPRPSDYAIEQVIAHHDRTTLYRAVETATGRVVAFKTVRLEDGPATDRSLWRERFLREAEAAARLRHPDIIRVHAGGVHQGLLSAPGSGNSGAKPAGPPVLTGWLALEWSNGSDLSRYTTASRLLPEALVLSLVGRLALALEQAHRAGVVHRDIKPANVLFDPNTQALKLTDFGSARVADAAATRSGLIIGTPAYMAPELLGGAEATPQSDLYALGVLMVELLTGHRPFESASVGELLGQIARQPVPPLSTWRTGLPPLLDDILQRLLAKSPAKRHQNGRQLALELRLALAQLPPSKGRAAAADAGPASPSALAVPTPTAAVPVAAPAPVVAADAAVAVVAAVAEAAAAHAHAPDPAPAPAPDAVAPAESEPGTEPPPRAGAVILPFPGLGLPVMHLPEPASAPAPAPAPASASSPAPMLPTQAPPAPAPAAAAPVDAGSLLHGILDDLAEPADAEDGDHPGWKDTEIDPDLVDEPAPLAASGASGPAAPARHAGRWQSKAQS